MSKLAAIVPAFNEARTIRDVVVRALREVPCLIVVDDGSTDGTAQALEGLAVTVLRNERNCGKAASLMQGMDHALAQGAQAVITLDGDGQHRPEDIPLLVSVHRKEPQALVIGSRLHDRANIPLSRYLANRFANFWIAWAAGQPIADSQSGLRLYPATLLREFGRRPEPAPGFVFESEILIEAGRRGVPLTDVAVAAIYPERARRSYFRPVLDITRIARMIAWKLLARGFYLPGLVRSLQHHTRSQVVPQAREGGEAR